jgi:hypothetical protein
LNLKQNAFREFVTRLHGLEAHVTDALPSFVRTHP